MANQWLISFSLALFGFVAQAQDNLVPLTLVDRAVEKGAVCIDGSPGGYHFAAGSGDGVDNWIVFLMGGGWCGSFCRDRHEGKRDRVFGSTNYVLNEPFYSMLSPNQTVNPDFYNWNRVYVRYCDGSFFLGDNEVFDEEVGAKLQLRGSKIYNAVIEELLQKGLKDANNVILSGGSAGGLATLLRCDEFRALLPNTKRVKCVSDSGLFIRAPNLSGSGSTWREEEYEDVVKVHNLASFLPKSCTSKMKPSLCVFGENLIADIKTPLFLLNSAFDLFEIRWEMRPEDPNMIHGWNDCSMKPSPTSCTPLQFQLIKEFGKAYLEVLKNLPHNPTRGMFITSCFLHVLTYRNDIWSGPRLKLQDKTVAQAVGDWYFDRSPMNIIDARTEPVLSCWP